MEKDDQNVFKMFRLSDRQQSNISNYTVDIQNIFNDCQESQCCLWIKMAALSFG